MKMKREILQVSKQKLPADALARLAEELGVDAQKLHAYLFSDENDPGKQDIGKIIHHLLEKNRALQADLAEKPGEKPFQVEEPSAVYVASKKEKPEFHMMNTLFFKIEASKKAMLENDAQSLNISVEELINRVLHDYLDEKEQKFQEARAYVRGRYKELYKRLA
jgi:hypothetical protein